MVARGTPGSPTALGPGLLVLALVLVLQFGLQAWFMPWGRLNDGTRLLHIDSAYHHYQMEVARQLCAEGRWSGYDPYFSGGRIAGIVPNASAKVQALAACAAGTADAVPAMYKQTSFWFGVMAPVALAGVALGLGLGPAAAALAGLLAIVAWWTGGLRWYHTAGMVSYVASAFLTIPFVAAVVAAATNPTALGVVVAAAFGALGMWIHPLFPVGALLAGGPWFLAAIGSGRGWLKALAVAALVAAAMLAANQVWIAESLQMIGRSPQPQPYQRDVLPALPLLEMLGQAPTAGGGLRLGAALVAGALLCVLLPGVPQRRALLSLGVGALLLMTWAAVGAVVPSIAPLQPNRFSSLAWLALVLPAAAGAAYCATRWREIAAGRRVGAAMLLLPASAVLAFCLWEGSREALGPGGIPRYAVAPPEAKGTGPVSRQVLAHLRDHTDPSARVFFETSMARVHDGAHMAGLYALDADREFVGGPYPHMDFAGSWDGFAFGAPFSDRSPQALAGWLDLYNVRWILCHSPACRAAIGALPDTMQQATLGPVAAYARAAAPGFVYQGRARIVQRCVNRVEVADAEGAPLILRYQWIPGLRAHPSGRVEPVTLVAGAPPFVAVHDAPSRFVLRVGAGAGRACDDRADARR